MLTTSRNRGGDGHIIIRLIYWKNIPLRIFIHLTRRLKLALILASRGRRIGQVKRKAAFRSKNLIAVGLSRAINHHIMTDDGIDGSALSNQVATLQSDGRLLDKLVVNNSRRICQVIDGRTITPQLNGTHVGTLVRIIQRTRVVTNIGITRAFLVHHPVIAATVNLGKSRLQYGCQQK